MEFGARIRNTCRWLHLLCRFPSPSSASDTPDALEVLAKSFTEGKPFPHIVIDNFVTIDEHDFNATFPTSKYWTIPGGTFNDGYQFQKRHCSEIAKLPALFRDIIYELSGPTFLKIFSEAITGIRGLLPDPYLEWRRVTLKWARRYFGTHVDFNFLGPLALHRRLNLLIYFNPEWKEEYGGCLELYEKERNEPAVTILPSFGRCILFRTDNNSIHGFSRPIIGENRWRKSLALYYYTSEGDDEINGVTYWQRHGNLHGTRLLQLLAYKTLIRGSQLLAVYAHRVNPHFRAGSRR